MLKFTKFQSHFLSCIDECSVKFVEMVVSFMLERFCVLRVCLKFHYQYCGMIQINLW